MIAQPPRRQRRPLVSAPWLLALCAITLLALLSLLPLAERRQTVALASAPSALSMSYLTLQLNRRPADRDLRLQLARKLVEVGAFDQARSTLLPLSTRSEALPDQVALLRVEIERRAWIAVDVQDTVARQRAIARLSKQMRSLPISGLDSTTAQSFAHTYREIERPLWAAELLDALARRDLPDAAQRVAAADAAWLEAGLPMKASEVQAWFALTHDERGVDHARLAIERAQSAGETAGALALFQRMRQRYPEDEGLLELGLGLAESSDLRLALELAAQRVQRHPSDAGAHRSMARLAEWNGDALRALDEYVWLVRHGGSAQERKRALDLARANWDLPLVRELIEGKPAPRAIKPSRRHRPNTRTSCQAATTANRTATLALSSDARSSDSRMETRSEAAADALTLNRRERIELYLALGDGEAALQQLMAAADAGASSDPELWRAILALQLRAGDDAAALATLTTLTERFPARDWSERLADMQLRHGDARAALHTLLATPGPSDEAWLRLVARVAWEAGERDREREGYQALIRLPAATRGDYHRLWELSSDQSTQLEVALASFERFGTLDMLSVASGIYAARGDDRRQLDLLARAAFMGDLIEQVGYWQTRITLHQRRAARDADRKRFTAAKLELRKASALLERAAKLAPATDDVYEKLWDGQHAQALSIALASDDEPLAREHYEARAPMLSLRERVYVLNRIGRRDEALQLAMAGARRDSLPESDRAALESEARNLADSVRYARAGNEALTMDGLFEWRSSAWVDYPERAWGLRAEASFTRSQPSFAKGSPALDDLGVKLGGRIAGTSLMLGVSVRDGGSARPSASLKQQLAGDDRAGLAMRLYVNTLATDTARLRVFGTRDGLALDARMPFARRFYASASASAETFYTREQRDYLGAGLTLDAAIGTQLALPAELGSANLRVASRVAPRMQHRPQDPRSPWLPETSEWVGLGAGIGRGQLDVPPIVGRTLCYVLDGSAGWLWPASGFGWTAQLGVGVSPLGGDLLTLAARGGNIVGSSVWSANLNYAVSLDL